jgi:hypothetical protein
MKRPTSAEKTTGNPTVTNTAEPSQTAALMVPMNRSNFDIHVTYHIAPTRQQRIYFQLAHQSVASLKMRWIVFLLLFVSAGAAFAGEGRVIKVLPLYLDNKGRDSLHPSLYERDAYQAVLRLHPDQRSALRFAVQWKARNVDWSKTRVVVETRGLENNTIVSHSVDHPLRKGGLFSKWANVDISGKDFKAMGELSAWRVTLWEGAHKLGEQKSFLW